MNSGGCEMKHTGSALKEDFIRQEEGIEIRWSMGKIGEETIWGKRNEWKEEKGSVQSTLTSGDYHAIYTSITSVAWGEYFWRPSEARPEIVSPQQAAPSAPCDGSSRRAAGAPVSYRCVVSSDTGAQETDTDITNTLVCFMHNEMLSLHSRMAYGFKWNMEKRRLQRRSMQTVRVRLVPWQHGSTTREELLINVFYFNPNQSNSSEPPEKNASVHIFFSTAVHFTRSLAWSRRLFHETSQIHGEGPFRTLTSHQMKQLIILLLRDPRQQRGPFI